MKPYLGGDKFHHIEGIAISGTCRSGTFVFQAVELLSWLILFAVFATIPALPFDCG